MPSDETDSDNADSDGQVTLPFAADVTNEATDSGSDITLISESPALPVSAVRYPYGSVLQSEDIFDGLRIYTGLHGYEGAGYIQLETGDFAETRVDIPNAQHYMIGARICAQDAVVSLTVNGTEQGAYFAKDATSFAMFFNDSVWLDSGANTLTFTCLRGIAYLDMIELHDSGVTDNSRYDISRAPANPKLSGEAVELLSFFDETFGKKILTGQVVTPNTNAETDAVFAATGSHPAVRSGDLKYYSRKYQGAEKLSNKEIELGIEYAGQGGIISYAWSWYAPSKNGDEDFSNVTSFNINRGFTREDISLLDPDSLAILLRDGDISDECYELILDIDDMAAHLQKLSDARVPVLWRPLMDAGVKGYYWWNEGGSDSYIWLWRLMFARFTYYHHLDNLIWVWSGEDPDFYPGDDYADMTASDIFNTTNSANAQRFSYSLRYGTGRKLTALSECALLPDPNIQLRDGAMWLWFCLYRGDYIIDEFGNLNSPFNTRERLYNTYHHELTLTREEIS